MRHNHRIPIVFLVSTVLLTLTHFVPTLNADVPWSVGRSTNDPDADLIEALTQRGRFEDALTICQTLSRGADPEGDASAKWAIRQSQVRSAQQMGQDRFAEDDIDSIAKPIAELLASYPQHRRKWFLLAESTMVQRNAAVHRVLRAAVSPTDDLARDEATQSLLRATSELEALNKEIGNARILIDQTPDDRSPAMLEDLARLQQELQVEAVSLALMQTELFASGSDDCIAAATRAEQIADQAITKLPADTQARREIERLRVESILRAGQLDRADQELKRLIQGSEPPQSPRWTALQVRLEMAQQRMSQAAVILGQYYGDQPTTAPRSIEMDLARLEFMLRNDPGGSSGDWLEAIEARGGPYARRRAEAMALALLGRSRQTEMPSIDPSIVAAQGQDYLRRGDPSRAAELLAAAARAETNADRAIERAAQAAAAFALVERHQEAAELLAEIANAKPDSPQSSSAHLQALVLAATHAGQTTQQTESMLRRHLQQWPQAETSAAARSWLQQLLIGQQRLVDAAEVATSVPVAQVTPESIDSIASQWSLAQSRASESSSVISDRFLAAYQPLLGNEIAAARYPLLVALLVDRELLSRAGLPREADSIDPFAAGLLAFRQFGTESGVIHSPPPDRIDQATLRLMLDGRANPVLRQSIARLLARWEGNQNRSLSHAERLLWLGQIEASVGVINELVRADADSGELARKGAELLQGSGDKTAMKEAIRLWDQLAAGTAQGSSLWHEAKLAAIAALRDAGKVTEAQRRAKYVLLTSPNMSDDVRRQYESFAN